MSDFVGSFTKIFSGNLLAQLVTFAVYPIITRLYTAEDMGLFSVTLSVILVFGQIKAMALNEAVIIAKDEAEANAVFALTLFISLCYFAIIGIMLIIVSNSAGFQNLLHLDQSLLRYLWFVPPGALLLNLVISANCFAIRKRQMGLLSAAKVGESVIGRSLVVLLGVLSFGAFGLLWGQIAGFFSSLLIQKRVFPKFKLLRPEFSRFNLWKTLRRFKTFPLYGQWSILLHVFSQESPIVLFGFFFGAAAAGFYGLGSRIISMPLIMFGDALHKVFLQHAAEIKDNLRELSSFTLKVLYYMSAIAMPGVLGLFFIGDDISAAVFGESWREAGVYLQFLVFYYFSGFIMRPLGGVYILKEKQKILMRFNLLILTSIVVVLCAAHISGASPRSAVLLLGVICPVIMLCNLYSALSIIGTDMRLAAKLLAMLLARLLPLALCLVLIKYAPAGLLFKFFTTAAACLIYYIVFALSDAQAKKLILRLLSRSN